jgi:nitrite reductase/ring-hydroxylating ferredoxin subunit
MLDDNYRYPFAPFPDGWFLLMESARLGAADVIPLQYFGRDLVLFRNEAGVAVLLDAHCPHMGAHLGYGGVVEGEGIRCPFHHWRFDSTGWCDDVPYTTAADPAKASVHCWPVHETSGLILAYHGAGSAAPAWRMPERAEWGKDGWVGYHTVSWTIQMHTQELAENIPDTTHFVYVHGLPTMPVAEVHTEGHRYIQRTVRRTPEGVETWVLRQEAYGLGLVWLEVDGDKPYTFLTATTPIDELHVELRLLFLVYEGPGVTELSPAGRAMADATAENTGRDVSIWEHKVYRERPMLMPGDGPIGVIRKWARQFYPATAEAGSNQR